MIDWVQSGLESSGEGRGGNESKSKSNQSGEPGSDGMEEMKVVSEFSWSLKFASKLAVSSSKSRKLLD